MLVRTGSTWKPQTLLVAVPLLLKRSSKFLRKLNMHWSVWLTNPTSRSSRKTDAYVLTKKIFRYIFRSTVIIKYKKQSRCWSDSNWINKSKLIHTMETTQQYRNKRVHSVTWTNPGSRLCPVGEGTCTRHWGNGESAESQNYRNRYSGCQGPAWGAELSRRGHMEIWRQQKYSLCRLW